MNTVRDLAHASGRPDGDDQRRKRRRNTLLAVLAVLTAGSMAYSCGGPAGDSPAPPPAAGAGAGVAETTTTRPVTINQSTVITGLGPGQAAQQLQGTFSNTDTQRVYVQSVRAAVAGTNRPNCSASDFILRGSPAKISTHVPPGLSQGTWSGITIEFHNKRTNQDACKNARVSITYTAH